MKLTIAGAAAVLSCLMIAACGGGGGGGPDFSPDKSLAQGVYEGTITYTDSTQPVNFAQQTIVLENGEFFIIYGNIYSNAFLLDGFLHGTGQITVSGDRFYSYDLSDHFFRDNAISAVFNGRLTATFSAGNSFNGTGRQTDSNVDFAGTAPPVSVYNYNVPADLAAVTGAWNMVDLLGNQLTVDIAYSGGPSASVTGSYPGGCSLTGTLTPRASGKNVFDAAITFGATPCLQPFQTFSGIARDYASAPGSLTFVFAGITANGDLGNTLFGIR